VQLHWIMCTKKLTDSQTVLSIIHTANNWTRKNETK